MEKSRGRIKELHVSLSKKMKKLARGDPQMMAPKDTLTNNLRIFRGIAFVVKEPVQRVLTNQKKNMLFIRPIRRDNTCDMAYALFPRFFRALYHVHVFPRLASLSYVASDSNRFTLFSFVETFKLYKTVFAFRGKDTFSFLAVSCDYCKANVLTFYFVSHRSTGLMDA